jgi:hypothetical protein
MGGSVGKVLKRSVGVLGMPGNFMINLAKTGSPKKALEKSYKDPFYETGTEDKPQEETAPDTASSIQTAIDEEEQKKKRKRGLAASILNNDFRFGGGSAGNNNTGNL